MPAARWRWGLGGLTVAALLALVCFPGTRWVLNTFYTMFFADHSARYPFFQPEALMGQEAGSEAGRDGGSDAGDTVDAGLRRQRQALDAEARRRSDDAGVQLAYILGRLDIGKPAGQRLASARVKNLLARLPRNPAVHAAWLNINAGGVLPAKGKPKAAPDVRADYERIAARGEAIDPGNAFFPVMRAIGRFAAGKDAEAIRHLHRAAGMRRWEDYSTEPNQGIVRLAEAVSRPGDPYAHAAATALMPLLDIDAISRAARMARDTVVAADRAGRTAQGLRIRPDLMHLGTLVRVQSRSALGVRLGIALHRIAIDRLAMTDDRRSRAFTFSQQLYYAYLRSVGRTSEMDRAHAQFEADAVANSILKDGIDRFYPNIELIKFTGFWAISHIPLSEGLSLLLFGVVAGLLGRLPRVRDGLPLRRTEGVLIVAGLAFLFFVPSGREAIASILIAVAAGITLSRREPFLEGVLRRVRLAAVPLACVLLLGGAGAVAGAARHQGRLANGVPRMLDHEGRFYAALLHRYWPE